LEGAPEPRSLAEVEKVLAGSEEVKEKKPLHIVLVAGRKDHGPGEHDYPAWLKVWGQLLEAAENVEVSQVMDWPDAKQLATADALVFYQQGTWNKERAKDLDAFLKRGGGVSYIHYAVDGGQDPEGFADRIGLAWGPGGKFRHGELDLIFDGKHPIARNLKRVHLHDESYWNLRGNVTNITLLASGQEENAMQPLILDVRRSVVSHRPVTRHRLVRQGTGGPLQRPGSPGSQFERITVGCEAMPAPERHGAIRRS
jgi:hypothetical protein